MLIKLNDIYFDDSLVAHISSFSNIIYEVNGNQVGYVINGNEIHLFDNIFFVNYFEKEVLIGELIVGYVSTNNDLYINSSLIKQF